LNYSQAQSSNEKRTINSYFLPAKKQVLENDTSSSQLTHDILTSKTSQFPSQISSCPSPTPCPSSTQTLPMSSTQIPQTFYSTDIGIDEASALLEESEDNEESEENGEEKKEISIAGEVLGKIIIKQMNSIGLDLEKCVGVGTDGCSVMVSELHGAVSEIIKVAPNARRCPCYNHLYYLYYSQSVKSLFLYSVKKYLYGKYGT